MLLIPVFAQAQSISDCIQQLALDYQKLANMKNVLSEMYKGYAVLTTGYTAVRDVSQGNFTLNEAFLDGLYVVSPTVRKYPRIQQIITQQGQLVSLCANLRKNTAYMSVDEIGYVSNVLDNVITRSLNNLDALGLVLSDQKLRMSDSERLRLIDQLYGESKEQLAFTLRMNDKLNTLAAHRAADQQNNRTTRQLYGLN